MSNDKPFQPEFGPNGAVLNAPTMTPEMRAKIDRAGKMPPADVIWRETRSIGFVLSVGLGIGLFGKEVRQFLLASPWWSGALFGALATVGLMFVSRITIQTLQRWELTGQRERRLTVPVSARALTAIADIVAAICVVGFMVGNIADLKDEYAAPRVVFAIAAIAALGLGAFLRWLANELRWVWRAPT